MKVVNVILTLNPTYGGPVEALRRGIEARESGAHERHVVCLDHPDSPWLSGWPCQVHGLGPGLSRYRFTPRLLSWLAANRRNFDAVIVNGVWNFSSIATWSSLKNTVTPYFLFTHGMLDPWFGRAYPRKHILKQIYWWALEGRALRDARCVFFTSEEERRLAAGAFRGHQSYRSHVVQYGTADAPPPSDAQTNAFRRAVPALGRRSFALFMSRIHPKKGCDLLVESFGRIADQYPDIDLVMAGPDQVGWKAILQSRAHELGIADRIHWPGMLTGDEKWGAYRSAKVFVLPSHSENFGIVLAEAMACGTPVLTTNKVNIWREIEKSEAGIIVDDNLDDFTVEFEHCLRQSDSVMAYMGQSARRSFLAQFEIEAATRSLFKAMEAMI